MATLELERVNVFLGPVHVIRDLSLTVKEGETVCLVGRNGAGKTTTLKSIIGLYPIRSGKTTYRGRDITNDPPHRRAKMGIGYSPEDARVFADLTVEENIEMAAWLAGSTGPSGSTVDDRVFTVFPELQRLLQRRALYCSGGEKKMLSIARALALNPQLLLLDEAFEGLAPVVVERFFKAIGEIKKMGISMLIAESNLTIGSRVADRLYAIDRGEIIYEGEPSKVFEKEEVIWTIRGY